MSDMEEAKRLFFEALDFLDANDYRSAELRLRDAVRFAPNSISILTNLSTALMQQHRPREAIAFAERAISVDPQSVEALLVMISCHAQGRDFDALLAACDRTIALDDKLVAIHSNRAVALNGLGRHAEALASCDRAIELQRNDPVIHLNRGNALAQLRRHDEALAAYDRALQLKPDLGKAWAARGHALASSRQFDEALSAFTRAIDLDPDLASAWLGRGAVYAALNRREEALSTCARAVAAKPGLAAGWLGQGNALASLQRFDEAVAAYDRALQIDPELTDALRERANACIQLSRYEEALLDFDKAFAMRPDSKYLGGERLHAKMQACEWRSFGEDCEQLRSSIAAGKAASVPFQILAIPCTPAEQLKCTQLFAADNLVGYPAPAWNGERDDDDRRLRIAYLSPDFRAHAFARLAAELFDRHDRSRFEIVAISFGPDDGSEIRQKLMRSFDRFIDVRGKSDHEIAELIRHMRIDIAVDLCGYTQHGRPGILAGRPARVQISYLGYPGTMGSPHMDYLIADKVLIPPEYRQGYSEKIVYLPESYQVNTRIWKIADQIPPRTELGLPPDAFVFCGFNNHFKITPDVFDVWMRLLRNVDNSVLWLLEGNPLATANLQREAAARGVSPGRVIFAPRLRIDAHLARQHRADLFLDTFNCGAHTTASDALWAGLPLVTCCGSTFASRVAASLLRALDLDELTTFSPSDYENLALRLAHDRAALAAIREKLWRNRQTHALFDTARFTRHLEGAYRTIWERARRGMPPEDISVPPIDAP